MRGLPAAKRHVDESRRMVEHQRQIISREHAQGLSTADSESLLEEFERSEDLCEEEVTAIERASLKRRDGAGRNRTPPLPGAAAMAWLRDRIRISLRVPKIDKLQSLGDLIRRHLPFLGHRERLCDREQGASPAAGIERVQ